MQLFLYNIFLLLFAVGIRIAALFNAKAALWLKGRKGILDKIKNDLAAKDEKRIWIHCSSLGEFEQGRPLIEAIKKQYPSYKIVLTFFSPSGYEVRKNYEGADYILYLPMDGASNARRFVELVNPALTIFVKYEFWYHYLNRLKKNNVPTVIISATFRKSQTFFQWYGGLFRKMLHCFDYLFVQDDESKRLLAAIGITNNVLVSGDTRYDRVAEISKTVKPLPLIEKFKGNGHLLIAGSTWPADERLLMEVINTLPPNWKLVIAPHEIDREHITAIDNSHASMAVLYSELEKEPVGYKVLIIDNIGMLSSLYSYGELAYIGGGFQKGGIHNVLEPAVFGLPVFFGPTYDKFIEAKALVSHQYAMPVRNAVDFNNLLQQLTQDNILRTSLQKSIRQYVSTQTGATARIMEILTAQWLK